MPTIKIHVDGEELDAIKRRAEALNISVQDLAYGALNCTMTHGKEAHCVGRLARAVEEGGKDLPSWADSARSIGIYESKPDIGAEPGPKASD